MLQGCLHGSQTHGTQNSVGLEALENGSQYPSRWGAGGSSDPQPEASEALAPKLSQQKQGLFLSVRL